MLACETCCTKKKGALHRLNHASWGVYKAVGCSALVDECVAEERTKLLKDGKEKAPFARCDSNFFWASLSFGRKPRRHGPAVPAPRSTQAKPGHARDQGSVSHCAVPGGSEGVGRLGCFARRCNGSKPKVRCLLGCAYCSACVCAWGGGSGMRRTALSHLMMWLSDLLRDAPCAVVPNGVIVGQSLALYHMFSTYLGDITQVLAF